MHKLCTQESERRSSFLTVKRVVWGIAVVIPFLIHHQNKRLSREAAEAAKPFENLGGAVSCHPKSLSEFIFTNLFGSGGDLITSIVFIDDPVTDDDLASLHGQFHRLGNLRRIVLENSAVTDRGVAVIADLTKLSWLRLDGTGVTDEGVKMLQEMTDMEELGLTDTGLTDRGMHYLNKMTALRTLMVSDTQVSDAGLEHLTGKSRLQMLTLRNTEVTDAGLSILSGLKQLRTLDLANTKISDEGVQHLVELRALQSLSLRGTMVTPDGIRRIREHLPTCDIYTH